MLRLWKTGSKKQHRLTLWEKIVLTAGYGAILYWLLRGLTYLAVLLA